MRKTLATGIYARRISTRRSASIFAVGLAAVALACGCGGSESSADGDTGTQAAPPTAPQPATQPPAPSTTGSGGTGELPGAGTDPVSSPSKSTETALLDDVRTARHAGFDRVVFQFRNALPGYRVEYVRPPLTEDGSGAEVDVAGRAFVTIRMEPASGFDVSTGEGELVYTGPRRISGSDAGTSTVEELVRTGDFEAVLTWAVGLADRVGFRVHTLTSPPRLVVDFRNG